MGAGLLVKRPGLRTRVMQSFAGEGKAGNEKIFRGKIEKAGFKRVRENSRRREEKTVASFL